jgi:hypothetical protein
MNWLIKFIIIILKKMRIGITLERSKSALSSTYTIEITKRNKKPNEKYIIIREIK